MRPASSGSLVKSMPGITWAAQKATCSVSAKKLSGLRLSTSRPIGVTGTSSSGMILVASSRSKLNFPASSSGINCTPKVHSGYSPASISSYRSRRWKSGSAPAIFTASSHTSEWVPSLGVRWNLTKVALPSRVTKRKVCTPKPSSCGNCVEWPGRTSATSACEEAMGPGTTGVHDALGNALMVEVGDLLAENEVLEQRRSADPRLERGLVIGDQHTLIGGQWPLGRRRAILVQ